MRIMKRLAILSVLLACGRIAFAQHAEASHEGTTPPRLLLLVHQEFQPGKASVRQKLEMAISQACDRLSVPNARIDLESITGRSEAVFFDPFDSFEQIDRAGAEWEKIFAKNPDIARLQEEIRALVSSERTVMAMRRDDLGYRVNSIDLSKARVMRVLEVHLRPGHENEFVEAFKMLSAAYEKINSSTPFVVYQVNVGERSPSFLVFVPMTALRQNDDLMARRSTFLSDQGEEGSERMQQIARDAYTSTESNLYVISPQRSHVGKESAAGDPEFWKRGLKTPHSKPAAKNSEGKPVEAKKN